MDVEINYKRSLIDGKAFVLIFMDTVLAGVPSWRAAMVWGECRLGKPAMFSKSVKFVGEWRTRDRTCNYIHRGVMSLHFGPFDSVDWSY